MSVSIPVLIAFCFFTQVAIQTSVCAFDRRCHLASTAILLQSDCVLQHFKMASCTVLANTREVWLCILGYACMLCQKGKQIPQAFYFHRNNYSENSECYTTGKYIPLSLKGKKKKKKDGGNFCWVNWVRLHISWTLTCSQADIMGHGRC